MTCETNNVQHGKKRKRNFGFLYLFLFVFLTALAGISYIVKSYSPEIDVTVGNSDTLTLSESDMNVEINSVDERLKWIQMEDEMPTVALRDSNKKEQKKTIIDYSDFEENTMSEKNKKEEKTEKKPPAITIAEIKLQKQDFRQASAAARPPVIPSPKPAFTKVYLGKYSSIEDAMSIQSKVSAENADLNPFIKAVNEYYIVQLGSFTEAERADELVSKLKNQGYSPKISYEN